MTLEKELAKIEWMRMSYRWFLFGSVACGAIVLLGNLPTSTLMVPFVLFAGFIGTFYLYNSTKRKLMIKFTVDVNAKPTN